jgi:protein-disulfide isomerase
MEKFQACVVSDAAKTRVELSRHEGERIGIQATPSIFINGRKQINHSEEALRETIKSLL